MKVGDWFHGARRGQAAPRHTTPHAALSAAERGAAQLSVPQAARDGANNRGSRTPRTNLTFTPRRITLTCGLLAGQRLAAERERLASARAHKGFVEAYACLAVRSIGPNLSVHRLGGRQSPVCFQFWVEWRAESVKKAGAVPRTALADRSSRGARGDRLGIVHPRQPVRARCCVGFTRGI